MLSHWTTVTLWRHPGDETEARPARMPRKMQRMVKTAKRPRRVGWWLRFASSLWKVHVARCKKRYSKKVKIQQLPCPLPQNSDPKSHLLRLIPRESSHIPCLIWSHTSIEAGKQGKICWWLLACDPARDHRSSFLSSSASFMKLHWGDDIASPLQSKEIFGPSDGEEASVWNECTSECRDLAYDMFLTNQPGNPWIFYVLLLAVE